ncbi:MAG: MogA/MoaB family molybdenum cofactor biosynthesis protein [Desulfovermiculus sp.]|nr:MogA/MoaB family molybdenum cofactor biosynthesis protein [Desulfovermiculus sp.]
MQCTLERLTLPVAKSGNILILTAHPLSGFDSNLILCPDMPGHIPVGSRMAPPGDQAWLQVLGQCWTPGHLRAPGFWVKVEKSFEKALLPCWCEMDKTGVSLAWITLSDSGAAGKRQDTSGPQIPEMISEHLSICLSQGFLLRDEASSIRSLLTHLTLDEGFDLIITTGGTGVAPRDVTADVTASLVDKRLPGFEQAMMGASLAVTPHAVISRAVVGILGTSLIINLPGSPKGVRENLTPLLPALGHTLDKIHGDPADCG